VDEFYKYASFCNKKGIKIYPIPTNIRDVYKIEIENNGEKNLEEKEYPNEKNKASISVWQKILELYKFYYNKIVCNENNF